MWLSDGAADPAGLCRTGHDVLHFPDHVRRIQGAPLCRAAAVEAHGAGRLERAQGRPRILRLHRSEAAGADEVVDGKKNELRKYSLRKAKRHREDYVQPSQSSERAESQDSGGTAGSFT